MGLLIQFPHPGSEHDDQSGAGWNTGNHRRKYLKIQGHYLESLQSEPIKSPINFWGEWEAQSNVEPIATEGKEGFPKFLFEPYYKSPIGRVNTDPFVFGDKFYYCICKQGHYPSLRNLNKGDMILFGSNLAGGFVLDTLFVIKDFFEYEPARIGSLKNTFNDAFYNVSLLPLSGAAEVPAKNVCSDTSDNGICIPDCGDNEHDSNPAAGVTKYRIYQAAMYEDRADFEGIFSFFPCLNESGDNNGFARPEIKLQQISEKLNQGIKIINDQSTGQVWKEIVDQVLKNNLGLGIKTELPVKIT